MKLESMEIVSKSRFSKQHPSEVAKAILEAVTSDTPDFRYLVGKDATMLIEARKNMSDREFQNLIKKQSNLQD